MEIKITNCDSVHELVIKTRRVEHEFDRNPTHLILSTAMAKKLAFELFGTTKWKRILGGKFYGMNVVVCDNKKIDYIDILCLKE